MGKGEVLLLASCLMLLLGVGAASGGQLSTSFHSKTCPGLGKIVWNAVHSAVSKDQRMAASLTRLFFHDCFVQGCDGSVLLDDTSSLKGEKNAPPNKDSLRGFDVIDDIKTAVESACPGVVSCADILALAAENSVYMSGGPGWYVYLGRRDSTTANFDEANNLPAPFEGVEALKSKFSNKGLSVTDLVALSGAHTFGKAQCFTYRDRLYNFNGTGNPDPTLDSSYLSSLQSTCPKDSGDNTLTDLDVTTPTRFDSRYFTNLRNGKGLLGSDQALYSTRGSDTVALVNKYASNWSSFWADFRSGMVNMGNINVLTGTAGEIRKSCRAVTN